MHQLFQTFLPESAKIRVKTRGILNIFHCINPGDLVACMGDQKIHSVSGRVGMYTVCKISTERQSGNLVKAEILRNSVGRGKEKNKTNYLLFR